MDTPMIHAKDLLKTSNIYRASINDTLSSALKHMSRTHDAIFVFDETNKFAGIINPYYVIYKKTYPPETKLLHCLYHPPVLTADTQLWDIAKLMRESKVYYLPVLAKNEFLGIVTINRLLRALSTTGLPAKMIFPTKQTITTVDHDATLQEAYTRMRDQNVSRLPVVNTHGHLVGIITRFDVQKLFATPKEKPRFLSKIAEKENFFARPLDSYYRKVVVTVKESAHPSQIIEQMLTNNVGSTIVVDGARKPTGIISTYDILTALSQLRPGERTRYDVKLPAGFIHETQLTGLLNHFIEKIEKRYPIRAVHVGIKADKNAAGRVKRYETTLQIEFVSKGPNVIAHAEAHDWKIAVRDVFAKIKKQLFD